MSFRVLGIDPGLTRCGIGVIDAAPNRTVVLVDVQVIRTPAALPLERRLLAIGEGIEELLDRWSPDAVALERVFAQNNLPTVMGTAQASGVAMYAAARHGLPIGLHTPSEVKAAITGYGNAEKKQVGTMVARVLGLDAVPKPADAADALAIAICHAWRSAAAPAASGLASAVSASALAGGALAGLSASSSAASLASSTLTPAQRAWLAAERNAAKSPGARRLRP